MLKGGEGAGIGNSGQGGNVVLHGAIKGEAYLRGVVSACRGREGRRGGRRQGGQLLESWEGSGRMKCLRVTAD